MGKISAAVIGSGFGGLAVAIRLQAAGCRNVIFEKRDQPGGRAYVYRDQGFTFDAGPTVITAPNCLRELFSLAGQSMSDYVELLPVHPFYRLFWRMGSRLTTPTMPPPSNGKSPLNRRATCAAMKSF